MYKKSRPAPPLSLGSCASVVWSKTAGSALWKKEPGSSLQPRVPPWSTHLSQEETNPLCQRWFLSGSRGQGSSFNQGHREQTLYQWVTRGIILHRILGWLQSLLTLYFSFPVYAMQIVFISLDRSLPWLTSYCKAYNVVRHLKTAGTPGFGISSIFSSIPPCENTFTLTDPSGFTKPSGLLQDPICVQIGCENRVQ